MPFGLRNAAQTFQRFMDSLFKHLPFVFCYLDDLIIASHTLEEHHEHLRQIFTILQENGLQINPSKCVFTASAVEFLGHRVDQHGVRPLPRHVQAISDFPPPQDVKQLQQILGMVNFYRRFLPGIAHTLQPLTDALRGAPKTLEWPPAAAFGAAKAALAAAVPVAHPCSPWQQTPPTHTRWRRASTAKRREFAAAGVLLQEAVGGGHQVLHLRQGAAGRIQRGQTFQIPAGGVTVLPTHQPQAAGHIPFPHHAAVVGPPAGTALLHHRIHGRYHTHTRPGEHGGRRLESPAFSSRAASAARPANLSRPHRRGLAGRGPGGNPFWPPSPMRNRSTFRRWPLRSNPAQKWRR
jgi:hypothetical protein